MPAENHVIGMEQLSVYDALIKNYISQHGGSYTLPTASASVLGGIKVGTGLSIDANGVLSSTGGGSYVLPKASASTLGGIKVGTRLSIDANGVLSAADQSYTLPIASDSILGGVKVDGTTITIDSNGIISSSGGGGGSYTLPIASYSTLGGVKISTTNGFGIDSSTGMLSLQKATSSQFGGVKVGDGLEGNAYTGVLTLKKASTSQLGGVKVDGTTIKADSNGVLSSGEPDYVIATPKMTSNTAPYGECIYSTQYSGSEAYRAFERNTSSYWRVDGNEPRIGSWIGYHFPNPVCITKLRTTNCGLSTTVKSFKLQGSDDGSTWTDIQSCTISSSSTNYVSTFDISNTTYYSYYRLYITDCFGSGDYMTGINEIEFLETIISQDGKGSGSSYTLPIAATSTLGGVKVDESNSDYFGIKISNTGSISFDRSCLLYFGQFYGASGSGVAGPDTTFAWKVGKWGDRDLYMFAFKDGHELTPGAYGHIKKCLRADVHELVKFDLNISQGIYQNKDWDDLGYDTDTDTLHYGKPALKKIADRLVLNLPYRDNCKLSGTFFFTKVEEGDLTYTRLYTVGVVRDVSIQKYGITITFTTGSNIEVSGTATNDFYIYSAHGGSSGNDDLPALDVTSAPKNSIFRPVALDSNSASPRVYLCNSNDDEIANANNTLYGFADFIIDGTEEGVVNFSYIKLSFIQGQTYDCSIMPFVVT